MAFEAYDDEDYDAAPGIWGIYSGRMRKKEREKRPTFQFPFLDSHLCQSVGMGVRVCKSVCIEEKISGREVTDYVAS